MSKAVKRILCPVCFPDDPDKYAGAVGLAWCDCKGSGMIEIEIDEEEQPTEAPSASQ
jgi:hypothetical protein